MSLNEQLSEDLKDAMRSRDELRLSTIRMLRSEIKNREIEARGPLDDGAVQAAIRSLVKQRRESIDAYRAAGREDLAAREAAEVDVLQKYLPAELGEAELAAIIDEVLAALPEGAPRQAGPITGQVMKRVAGRADGRRVTEAVKARLGG
jgi:uncharacterized protein YqeY